MGCTASLDVSGVAVISYQASPKVILHEILHSTGQRHIEDESCDAISKSNRPLMCQGTYDGEAILQRNCEVALSFRSVGEDPTPTACWVDKRQ